MKHSNWYGFRQLLHRARRAGSRAGREEGNQLFELALVTPLLSMLLLGIMYGGMTFYNYVELTNAVAVGARTLAINRAAYAGPPTACSLEQTALKNAAGNLTTSKITIATEVFTGSSVCTALQPGTAGTVSATYPCNLAIPFSSLNLCPVTGGTGACPSAYCISATTTVYIQ
jgi:Flp pilus assembly protein TadG